MSSSILSMILDRRMPLGRKKINYLHFPFIFAAKCKYIEIKFCMNTDLS